MCPIPNLLFQHNCHLLPFCLYFLGSPRQHHELGSLTHAFCPHLPLPQPPARLSPPAEMCISRALTQKGRASTPWRQQFRGCEPWAGDISVLPSFQRMDRGTLAGGDGNGSLSREPELSREGSWPEGAQQALPRLAVSPPLRSHLEGAREKLHLFLGPAAWVGQGPISQTTRHQRPPFSLSGSAQP